MDQKMESAQKKKIATKKESEPKKDNSLKEDTLKDTEMMLICNFNVCCLYLDLCCPIFILI